MVKLIKEGEFVPRSLSKSGFVPQGVPEDGVLIEQPYSPSIYISFSDLEEIMGLRDGTGDVELELDSWGNHDETQAQ